jgi:tRNA 2-thiouridine synthesizing protein D
MKFSLLILGSPTSTSSVNTAYRFACSSLKKGHNLYRIFFYHDAVNTGNALTVSPQDEKNLSQQWQQLANEHQIDMVVCVASALKRGVLDASEADRYEKKSSNLETGYEISGLGQLVDAAIHSDRLITFGS